MKSSKKDKEIKFSKKEHQDFEKMLLEEASKASSVTDSSPLKVEVAPVLSMVMLSYSMPLVLNTKTDGTLGDSTS